MQHAKFATFPLTSRESSKSWGKCLVFLLFVRSIMKKLVRRLVNAGHLEEVATAGEYAKFLVSSRVYRVEGVRYTPSGHDADELFAAIEKANVEAQTAIAEFIDDLLGVDFDELAEVA